MFLRTYAKWIDGSRNDLEMTRLEDALTNPESRSKASAGNRLLTSGDGATADRRCRLVCLSLCMFGSVSHLS